MRYSRRQIRKAIPRPLCTEITTKTHALLIRIAEKDNREFLQTIENAVSLYAIYVLGPEKKEPPVTRRRGGPITTMPINQVARQMQKDAQQRADAEERRHSGRKRNG